MTVTAEQIAIAKSYGLTNVEALATACDKHDLRFYLGLAILQKETGGRNIYGHDRGGVFTTKDGSNIEVTAENFAEFWRRVSAGETSNGVGPMQITYRGHFPKMEKLGLLPWLPAHNIEYGISLIAADYRRRRDNGDGVIDAFHYAACVYNLGSFSPSWPYGLDAVAKAEVWKKRVGTADLDNPKDPLVKHSIRWNADYVWWNGGNVTVQDAEILTAVQNEIRPWWGNLRLSQGGLSSSVAASANTHVGLGAGDIAIDGRSQSLVWKLCSVLLRSGIVAFPRGYGDGMTPKHIHWVSRESLASAHAEAKAQLNSRVFGYLHKVLGKRGAGLAGAKWRRYIGPSTASERWDTSPYNPANVTADTGTYTVTATTLLGLNVDRQPIKERAKGFPVVAAKRVRRWGRDNVVTAAGTYYSTEFLTLTPQENQS